ncbi:response regulator [Rheinheimera sp.]|uniref:response regulator transcription factor n=1 Tax=Rheinheimera sp. TaxID=1869214 RepID=UPI00307DCCD6
MRRETHTVLLVDDQEFTRQLLQNNLTHLKLEARLEKYIWSFQHAHNASLALKLFNMYQPELVFLDIELPDQSGLQLLRRFKEINPDCFVVMVSGVSTLNNVKESISSGASSFVVKPFFGEKILSVLSKFKQHCAKA